MDPDFNTKRFLLLLINFNFTETTSCYPSSDFSSYFCFPKKLPTKAVRFAGIQSGFVLFKYKKSINTNTNTRRTNLGKLWKKLPAPSICEAVRFYIIQRQGRLVSVINKIRHRTHVDSFLFEEINGVFGSGGIVILSFHFVLFCFLLKSKMKS